MKRGGRGWGRDSLETYPHVKQASNAKTKTTATMLDAEVLIATQMASATRTRHMPTALEMKSLRRPTRSIVHHWKKLLLARNDGI